MSSNSKDLGSGGNGSSFWEMTVQRNGPDVSAIDEAEVRRALGLFVDPKYGVQIQSLPSGRWEHCDGANLDSVVRTVAKLSGEQGVFFSLNPYRVPLDHALLNVDILCRRWFLIDPDAVKTETDSSTSEDEKECARQVTEAIRDFLRDRGWPDPVYVDSGNNWQLLYRIDLPNDKLSQQILSKALKAIGERFDTSRVAVDRKVHDAKRICKIPGTMVRKGDNTPERPWRQSRLMSLPMVLTPVTAEMIKDVAKLASKTKATATPEYPAPEYSIGDLDPWLMKVGKSDNRKAYAQTALNREVEIVEVAQQPGRNGVLYVSALKLGTLVAAGLLDEPEVKQKLFAAGVACGLGQDGDPHEIRRAITNGFAYGIQNPRVIPEQAAAKGAAPTAKPAPDGTIIVRASEVTPRKVEWLWPGRIPLGKLTTFAGVGGLGKTFVLCDISARVSRGDCWPDSDGECVPRGQVLFVSGEDDPDDTLVPRMIELGADLERIVFLKTEVQDRFTLADLPTLDKALEQMGEGVSFVVIDPPTAYLGGCDDHKNSELRSLLSPLKSWASRHRVAVVFNTHVSKPQGAKVEAMMRVMGSVAWVNAVRAAHMFAKDPEDPSRRLFVGMKLNIGKERKGLAYRIIDTDTLAKVEWLGEVDVTADDAVNGDKKKSRGVVATEWLMDQFRKQREWPSEELKTAAREAGISKNALWSPEVSALPIKKVRHVTADGEARYTWVAQPGWPPALGSQPPGSERESGKAGKQERKPLPANTHQVVPKSDTDRESGKDRESSPAFPAPGIPDPGNADRESRKDLKDNDLGGSFPAFPVSQGDIGIDWENEPPPF